MSDSLSRLLFESESDSLDFKRDQYRFIKATDKEKSELLKDILAFANAWRRTDAYILIGTEEVRGQKAIVRGITEHLDDAQLQQFVNSKTNRIVNFSYQTQALEGKAVGIIYLPVQERPTFLDKPFGGLKGNTVYVRRGSSTDIATPEEIAQIGAANQVLRTLPSLEIQFADAGKHLALGTSLQLRSLFLKFPRKSEIPELPTQISGPFGFTIPSHGPPTNTEYYRDLAEYSYLHTLLQPLGFWIKNTGESHIDNLTVEVMIQYQQGLVVSEDKPQKPSYTRFPNFSGIIEREDAISLIRGNDHCLVKFGIRSLQPKADFWSESLYIGSEVSCMLELTVKVLGNNVVEPIASTLNIQIDTEAKNKTLSDLYRIDREVSRRYSIQE